MSFTSDNFCSVSKYSTRDPRGRLLRSRNCLPPTTAAAHTFSTDVFPCFCFAFTA